MRRLAASFFITLDGVVEDPERWQAPYFDEQMGAELGQAMAASEGFVLGRRTYEQWAGFWPGQPSGDPMAAAINAAPKYVGSTTLGQADWQNSTVLEGDAVTAVAALKEQPGGDLQTSGSRTLVRALLNAGLVDELRLLIHPVVVGQGRRLFEPGDSFALDLVRATPFASGVVSAAYAVKGDA